MTETDIQEKYERASLHQKQRADAVAYLVEKLTEQKKELDRMVAKGILLIRSSSTYANVNSLDDIGTLDSFEEWTIKLHDRSPTTLLGTISLIHTVVPPARAAGSASISILNAKTELEKLTEHTDAILKNDEMDITERCKMLVTAEETYTDTLTEVTKSFLRKAEESIVTFIDAYKEQGRDLDDVDILEYNSKSPDQRRQMMENYRDATFENTPDSHDISTFRKRIRMLQMSNRNQWHSDLKASLIELRGSINAIKTI